MMNSPPGVPPNPAEDEPAADSGTRRSRPARALTPQEIALLQSQAPVDAPASPQVTAPPAPDLPVADPPPVDPVWARTVADEAPLPGAAPATVSPSPMLSARAGQIIGRVAVGVLLAYTLSVFVGWATVFGPSELEGSWNMVLHWAFLNRARFGTDIIFTYGPLGFLLQGFHPSTLGWVALTWAGLGAVWFMTLLRLTERLQAPRIVLWLGMAGLIAVLGSGFEMMGDARVFVTCWSLVLVHFFVDPRPLSAHKIALVILMAVVSLGKFSLAMLSMVSLLLVCVDLVQRRKPPWLLGIWSGAVTALWFVAGQGLGNVVSFLRYSMQISTGYAQGEGLWSEHEARDVLLFLAAGVGVVAMVVLNRFTELSAMRSRRAWGKPPIRERAISSLLAIGGLIMAIFLLFKIGYVRHDRHEIIATTGLAVLGVMYAAAIWPGARSRLQRGMLIAVPLCCLGLAMFSYRLWEPIGFVTHLSRTVSVAPGRTWNTLRALVGDSVMRREYDRLLEGFRDHRVLPELKGTVDGFSFIQRAMLADGMEYHPRPIFQGYLAFTPDLGRLNARHFTDADAHAPQWVIFDPQKIDQIYPSMVDAVVWPELLGRYRVDRVISGASLLERVENAEGAALVPISRHSLRLGEWIDVPQPGQPVWGKIRLRQTLPGRIVETLYKPPLMRMELKLKNGQNAKGTIVPRMAGEGFVLSPIVSGSDSFTLLFSDRLMELLDAQVVNQLRVVRDDLATSTYAFDSEYEVEFFEMRYPRQDLSQVPAFAELMQVRWMERNFGLLQPTAAPKRIYDFSGRAVVLAPPVSRFIVKVPPGSVRVRIQYGMVSAPYLGSTMDPVTFNIYTAEMVGEQVSAERFWSRRMDPRRSPTDQGMQIQVFNLPAPPPSNLVLETDRGESQTSGGSYWASVEFE